MEHQHDSAVGALLALVWHVYIALVHQADIVEGVPWVHERPLLKLLDLTFSVPAVFHVLDICLAQHMLHSYSDRIKVARYNALARVTEHVDALDHSRQRMLAFHALRVQHVSIELFKERLDFLGKDGRRGRIISTNEHEDTLVFHLRRFGHIVRFKLFCSTDALAQIHGLRPLDRLANILVVALARPKWEATRYHGTRETLRIQDHHMAAHVGTRREASHNRAIFRRIQLRQAAIGSSLIWPYLSGQKVHVQFNILIIIVAVCDNQLN